MYGLNDVGGYVGCAEKPYQPTEEELKKSKMQRSFYEFKDAFRSFEFVSDFVTVGIMTKEEARKILDVDGLISLIDEARTVFTS